MAEVKRWSVTYTKHMKQKRKVYQDGFLELHTSTNKVHSDHVKADTARHNTDCVSDESRSGSCVSHVAADNEKIVSQEPSCARKVERPSFELEGPSFDLGF